MNTSLILLHGAIGSKDQLAALKNLLSSHYEVYDLNFSGHGSKPVDGNFSIPAFAEEVRLLYEGKPDSWRRFFVPAWADMALYLALTHPRAGQQPGDDPGHQIRLGPRHRRKRK
ncbi:MAG: hypothetical protein IPN33_24315 [Saprospiraceae bacterium]|nr:hypothetical protein [Saprospiraceae bacterium]